MDEIEIRRHIKQRAISEESGMNRRLLWIREKLNISLTEASRKTEIPISSLHGWENYTRTYMYESLMILVLYYNELWQNRFLGGFPRLEGVEVEYISLNFLFMGKDPTIEDLKQFNSRIHERLTKELMDLSINYQDAKHQLDMFKEGA